MLKLRRLLYLKSQLIKRMEESYSKFFLLGCLLRVIIYNMVITYLWVPSQRQRCVAYETPDPNHHFVRCCLLLCCKKQVHYILRLSAYEVFICITNRIQMETQLLQGPLADHQSHSIDRKQSQDSHGRQRLCGVKLKIQ